MALRNAVSTILPTLLHLVALIIGPLSIAALPGDILFDHLHNFGINQSVLEQAADGDRAAMEQVPTLDAGTLAKLARWRSVERKSAFLGLGMLIIASGAIIVVATSTTEEVLPRSLLWLARGDPGVEACFGTASLD
jgi:hypothetical protein